MSIETKLDTITNNETKVYEAGKRMGERTGQALGQESGKQEMLDTAWNAITCNNTRTTYDRGFSWWRIEPSFFRPPQTLKVTGTSSQMFYWAYPETGKPLDAQALEDELGHPLFDTSEATRLDYFNNPGVFSTLGIIDLSSCTTSAALSQFCSTNTTANYLTSIKKLIVSANTYFVSTMFRYCSALTHCPFEGTIGTNGLTMSFCTSLDKESLTSIVNCLSTTTSSLTVTLSKAAVDKAFETSSGANNGSTSGEWTTLKGTKTNWTITLA